MAPGSTCHCAGVKLGTDDLLGALVVDSEREIKYRQRRVLPETSLEMYQTGRSYMVKDSDHSICLVLARGLEKLMKCPAQYRDLARVYHMFQLVFRKLKFRPVDSAHFNVYEPGWFVGLVNSSKNLFI